MASKSTSIQLQVMWNRLISVVEEQAQTLIRTAFSPIVRESGDLSAGVFSPEGDMLAQAVTGTPGHVNSMARSVAHFLNYFPAKSMAAGDVYITNDPWMGTGHLHDMVVVTPVFFKTRLVGLFACTSHLIDIGGIGFGPDGRDVIEEGLYVPFLKLADRGTLNETLLKIVRGNSRYPIECEGDILSLAACNDIGRNRLCEMMQEFGIASLKELGDFIIDSSYRAVKKEIRKLPKGTFHASMRVDGYDKPIDLVASLTIKDDKIVVDYSGTSGPSPFGINVPMAYCEAYTTYGINCIIAPEVPNNAGTLRAVEVRAPQDTILNAQRPAPVSSRHIVGQMLPDVIFGCLAQVVPDCVPAEGASCLWNLILQNHATTNNGDSDKSFSKFSVLAVQTGGMGARPTLDGLSATAFPSGVSGLPVEIVESISPLVFWKKELKAGSGGSGRTRGGLGQIIEIENRENVDFEIYAALDRIDHPPRGRNGGESGAPGYLGLLSGRKLRGKGRQTVPAGDRLVVHTPGGAGFGFLTERKAEQLQRDIELEIVSP